MKVLNSYIQRLITESTPQAPIWNIEQIRENKDSTWNYMDGCVIKSILDLYEITAEKKYLDFADNFVDYFIMDDGTIKTFDPEEYNLDSINASKNLFQLYKLTKKEKYRKAIEKTIDALKAQPRTESGNFWHKKIYPNQVWLDGLYMGQPLYMEYEAEYNNQKECLDTINQIKNVVKNMKDTRTGLYYHAFDESRKMFWCDPVTGLSQCFWSRALGWFAMALADTYEKTPDNLKEEKEYLKKIFCDLMHALLQYQDESGMWYQVTNLTGITPNYLETSGSAIFAYALMKGARLGLVPEDYYKYGEKAFYAICDKYLSEKDGELQLGGICLVAGLGGNDNREGTFEYYMREPIVENEAKGVAPLIMAYTEILRKNKTK